ncbi:hypothetical protein EJB05_29195, partial [Eragrostis curvula]
MTKRSGSSRRKKAKQRAAAAAYPPWILLERHCTEEIHGSSSSVADTKTRAAGRTAAGSQISVALSAAVPPESSRVCVQVQLPNGVKLQHCTILAAHGDSVLIDVTVKEDWKGEKADYFVYSAGDAAADPPRPPSLLLLPPLPLTEEQDREQRQQRFLYRDDTGLLRRGEDDELLVAQLRMERADKEAAPELLMFRSGEWSIRRPLFISNGDGMEPDLPQSWYTRTAVPVGDRLLCWSDQLHGVVFSDVFDENPTLRYVPFPIDSPCGFKVCATTATAGGDTLKLVTMYPRCCCGDVGASKCPRSLHAYTIKTWMLRMEDMAWVMDGMVDTTEIWALDAYKGFPRVGLDDPVVSLDDPNTIAFAMCEDHHVRHGGDSTVRLLMVDTRTKTISSVFCYPRERQYFRFNLIPSRVSSYLNPSYPSQGNGGTSSPSKIDMDSTSEAPPIIVK